MTLRAIRLLATVLAFNIGVWSTPLPAQTTSPQSEELQEANQLFKQGQLDRALERVNAHLAKNPKDARGRFLRGIILTEQNKPGEAIKVFTELTQEFPELPEPYNNLAVLYASQGQYDKARTALEMAIKDLFPASKPARTSTKAEPPAKVATAPAATRPTPGQPAAPAPAQPAAPAPTPSAQPAAPPAKAAEPAAAPAKEPVAKAAPQKEPPAAKPEAARAAAENPDEVVKSLKGWAKAWSSNDVEGYLAHYAPDFRTPKGEKRSEWEAQRKARVAKPRKIEVDIEAPKVTFNDAKRVTVTFRQRYESGSIKVSSTKTVVMVRAGDKWLIQEERVGS
jgi:tetratricopeptide (TPR) repeat protein